MPRWLFMHVWLLKCFFYFVFEFRKYPPCMNRSIAVYKNSKKNRQLYEKNRAR